MRFYSTKSKDKFTDLATAVLKSLPPDNGLYMPEKLYRVDDSFIRDIGKHSFLEIAYYLTTLQFGNVLTRDQIESICNHTITFPAPIVSLEPQINILELWHGPSLAFKDFGARFMASLMSALIAGKKEKLTILVATSGDTGGAVASGFLGVENIEVIILYPSGKVSKLQEKQLTTLGENITALEVEGTFDDCQAMVKAAFLDETLNDALFLSSANSINIARLFPQSFYYFEAYRQLQKDDLVFCVPSGNFGNLTAGLMAQKMGLPISKFIAATNQNDVVPKYLHTGLFEPKPSVATVSNAMDVGNPSNFPRMLDLFGGSYEEMKKMIAGYAFSDEATSLQIEETFNAYNYMLDPHGAVGMLALKEYLALYGGTGIVLETAHPSKFIPVMPKSTYPVDIPSRLAVLADRKKSAIQIKSDFQEFKNWLLSRI